MSEKDKRKVKRDLERLNAVLARELQRARANIPRGMSTS